MSLYQYLITILFLIGCSASTATESDTHRIKFKHFSFSTPNTDTWKLAEKAPYQAVFTARHGKAMYRITIIENDIYDPRIKALSAKEVADDFRNHEKFGMMEFGVKRGLYELRDLTMGDEQIGNKVFYTMKYSTFHPQVFQAARLYLYFPFEEENNYFLVAHYSEAAPSQTSLKQPYEPDFIQLLTTVSHHDE